MSDIIGRIRRGKGERSRTFRIEGNLSAAEWAELIEKLRKVLAQYGVKLTKA